MDSADIIGRGDLYAALRQAATGVAADRVGGLLAGIKASLAKGDTAAQDTLRRLDAVDQGLLQAVIRRGAGLCATTGETSVSQWLMRCDVAPLFQPDIKGSATIALLTNGEHPDMPAFSDRAFDAWFASKGVCYGLGSYGEKRSVYATDQFADAASDERRTRHLGIDVFAAAGHAVHAPLNGRVRHVTYNADPLDYGHTLIVEHEADGAPFWTLYGHLAGTLPGLVQVGNDVVAGQHIADLGDWHENGGWAAHLHFQIMTDMLQQNAGNFFGVGHDSLWDVWSGICIDPNLILRLPEAAFTL